MGDVANAIRKILTRDRLTHKQLAVILGASHASVVRWEAGTGTPSDRTCKRIWNILESGSDQQCATKHVFASTGLQRGRVESSAVTQEPRFSDEPLAPVLERLSTGRDTLLLGNQVSVNQLLLDHVTAAPTRKSPAPGGISAGKNTYTYDAHTYHTKVPPQGIAELLEAYLPHGGLVLDPFAGSGMTGVAAATTGHDCLLVELSPAACFIADRFTNRVPVASFDAAVNSVINELGKLANLLYSTRCRECGKRANLLYTVWSYLVLCPECSCEFNLWDVCRSYGRTVREHKILSEFKCPRCAAILKKSKLTRTTAEPVQVGYICCGSRRIEVVHTPDSEDIALINRIESGEVAPLEGWYPKIDVPAGVNLSQPLRHGLDRIDKFYTRRNLVALSHLWRRIHCLEDAQLAGQLAFTFTSLYRRVTKFSEFRFWGGSGNTARLNVPFIFDEPNVFLSFRRKARTISDHLSTSALAYRGRVTISEGSATDLSALPDESVDLIFTDPPFGANINYSEMNLLWEAWLGRFTEPANEAIVNKVQGKDVGDYGKLMTESLRECHRVLRAGHWMLLVFMNSSARVWKELEAAIGSAGFVIVQADIFDKQHGTFKQFVSANTPGADLILHCLKQPNPSFPDARAANPDVELQSFLASVDWDCYAQSFLHVDREEEVDLRRLYSEWVASAMGAGLTVPDFAAFRLAAATWLARHGAPG